MRKLKPGVWAITPEFEIYRMNEFDVHRVHITQFIPHNERTLDTSFLVSCCEDDRYPISSLELILRGVPKDEI